MVPERRLPNILITGTPGTGKTTLAELVAASEPGFRHVNVGDLVKERELHDGFDEEFDSYILNEDKLCDELEGIIGQSEGGCVVDYHGCDFFPERWFDLVICLRCDNTILYDRLESRGYKESKIQENVECEIMQVVLEEARESWPVDCVVELRSDSVDDVEDNLQRTREWISTWRLQRQN